MKIAIVSSSYPVTVGDPSGLFVQYEADKLHAAGHTVVVITPGAKRQFSAKGPLVLGIDDWGAFGHPGAATRLRQRPYRALGLLAFSLGARRCLRQHGPFDAIQAHWLLPSGWPICWGFSSRTTSVEVVLHGGDVRALCALPAVVRRKIVFSILEQGARLRFVSRNLQTQLSRATSLQVLPQSYVRACQTNTTGTPTRCEARARLGLVPDQRLAVIVGRLIATKRIATALQALKDLPHLKVVVVGGGTDSQSLRYDFPNVSFVGRQPHNKTLQFIAAADVVVSASRVEGSPLAIREARHLGVPVVALAAGDLEERAAQDPYLHVLPAAHCEDL